MHNSAALAPLTALDAGSSSVSLLATSVAESMAGSVADVESEARRRLAHSSKLVERAGAEESLRSFRLLEALRGGDPATILSLLGRRSPSASTTHLDDSASSMLSSNGSTPLHLAIKCGTSSTVKLVLSNSPPAHVAAQDSKGRSPLHLACHLNRPDVVAILMAQPLIDDSLKDGAGKTCLELCKGPDCARMIQVARAQLNGRYIALLGLYIFSPTTMVVSSPSPNGEVRDNLADQMWLFLDKPRARIVDLNVRDEVAGTTLLHEAARRRDVYLLKQAIARGADVLLLDRKNKMPIQVARDEKVQNILRQTATAEGRFLRAQAQGKPLSPEGAAFVAAHAGGPGSYSATAVNGAPVMKGYLSKWTNLAKGYHSRWIVLENGYLSYYRDQQEEGQAVRGSFSMAIATVYGPETTRNKLQFEVAALNVGGNNKSNHPRLYFKASHPVEAMRWITTIGNAIEYAKQATASTSDAASSSVARPTTTPPLRTSVDTDRRSFVSRHLRKAQSYRNVSKTPSMSDVATPPVDVFHGEFFAPRHQGGPSTFSSGQSMTAASLTDDDSYVGVKESAPFESDMDILAQSIKTHVEMTEQLLASLSIPTSPQMGGGKDLDGVERTTNVRAARATEVKSALSSALQGLDGMIDDYMSKVLTRERWHVRRYERELAAKELWASNIAELAAQQEEMEEELQVQAETNNRRKKQIKAMRLSIIASESSPPIVIEHGEEEEPTEAQVYRDEALASANSDQTTTSMVATSPSGTVRSIPTIAVFGDDGERGGCDVGEEDEVDSDDEFFEAIEAGVIQPNLQLLTDNSDIPIDFPGDIVEEIKFTGQGHEIKRLKLPISSDDRPSVSLWGILKNSIGKDLTKISFPVSFNEPVSMLQRMAEDMEFTECLDAAASSPDSLKRIAYVAAFAMSNYSSTVGRIAKPFNPLLGETFEYVDLEKKYRYISEQVSHHPPMSACIGESPRWKYYGEVDAKNKFTGKSFEIRPSGVAHALLRIPKEWQPTYPPDEVMKETRVEEHYSWKKVTTVVSNFILGSPTIDHYGDMEIVNHRSGEKCTLTFKPRGWRNKDAQEIKGSVFDASGNVIWDIAGKWTTQLIARRAGLSTTELAPDVKVDGTAPEYILLWKNNPTLNNSPFNFTSFAITLNNLNEELRQILPRTDCRLRPDQHSFERGNWELANQLKTDLEDLQRSTRRQRETGQLPTHKPRWFKPVIDKDTNERVWKPCRDGIDNEGENGPLSYWEERKRVQKGLGSYQWSNVDDIFGQFGLIGDSG